MTLPNERTRAVPYTFATPVGVFLKLGVCLRILHFSKQPFSLWVGLSLSTVKRRPPCGYLHVL